MLKVHTIAPRITSNEQEPRYYLLFGVIISRISTWFCLLYTLHYQYGRLRYMHVYGSWISRMLQNQKGIMSSSLQFWICNCFTFYTCESTCCTSLWNSDVYQCMTAGKLVSTSMKLKWTRRNKGLGRYTRLGRSYSWSSNFTFPRNFQSVLGINLCSGRVISSSQTHNRRTSIPRWDSNPQSQQASGCRPTP